MSMAVYRSLKMTVVKEEKAMVVSVAHSRK